MIRSSLEAVLVLCLTPALIAQQTPAPPPSVPASAPAPVVSNAPASVSPHTLMDGTPIKLRLSQTISSADAHVNQEVPFDVVDEVRVEDAVVLSKGATAIATITEAQPKRRMGRGGKLDLSISYARLVDGEKLPLRAMKEAKGGGHVGAMTGAIVATSLIVWPAAPFFLFMHGKDITIPAGTEITAFIEGDMRLDMARFSAAPPMPSSAPAASATQASLTIDSLPPGADIEVDGNYVGNTPSTLSLARGSHDVTVKKKGFADWNRKLTVTNGNVRVNAELDPKAGE